MRLFSSTKVSGQTSRINSSFSDDTPGVTDQHEEKIKRFRSQSYDLALAQQHSFHGVQSERPEFVDTVSLRTHTRVKFSKFLATI